MKLTPLYKSFQSFFSLLFPEVCVSCGTALVDQEETLCTVCRWSLPETFYHQMKQHSLKDKFSYQKKIDYVSSFLFYHQSGVAQRLIHTAKYKNRPDILTNVGHWYGYQIQNISVLSQSTAIIPVPLHHKKLLKRGFNQSEVFAESLSEYLGVNVLPDLVSRVTYTATQTKKSKIERLNNVEAIFHINDPKVVEGGSFVLVDDVITTGATIGELANLLIEAGADKIHIISIACGK